MRGTLAAVIIAGLFLGSMLRTVVTDMCKDEIRPGAAGFHMC
jgi:hypothetical protein